MKRFSTIGERIKAYYETDDFKDNYKFVLLEEFASNENEVLNRIANIVQHEYYFAEKYGFNNFITREQAKIIYDFIESNFDEFIDDYCGYYVGCTSLESVSFGEQEESIYDFWNHQTNKPYNRRYIKKSFENAGYYVNDRNYAYYDLSGHGLHIDLLKYELPEKIINQIKKEETKND